jgi:hypothetical protein
MKPMLRDLIILAVIIVSINCGHPDSAMALKL